MASRNRHAFAKRCLSAAVLVPVVLAAIWAGGPWYGALLLGVAGLMAKEWVDICFARDGRGPWAARPDPGAVAFMASVALACLAGTLGHYAVALLIAAAGLLAVGALSGARMRSDGVILAAGVLYIVLPITAAAWIGHDPEHGVKTLFWLLATVWATDSGAFLTGRWLGGPKLAPVISPAKTWSGFFGGLVGAALVAAAAGALGLIPSSGRFIALGLAVSLVAQGGDLLESRFKRHFEVKDSGTIIPGHGGVLDRLDSLLTALPFVAAVELWMGNGETLWR